MTTSTIDKSNPTMTREWFVELNIPNEANLQLRCASTDQAVSYIKKIFPTCNIKPLDLVTSYVYLDKNPETVIGVITEIQVPEIWVSNRRLSDFERKAA